MKQLILALSSLLICVAGTYAQLDSNLLQLVQKGTLIEIAGKISSVDLNAVDENGANILMWAAYYRDIDVVKMLVSNGATPCRHCAIFIDNEGSYYGNLQGIPAGTGKLSLLKYLYEELHLDLTEREFNPKTKEHDGWTPIAWAVNNNHPLIFQFLTNQQYSNGKMDELLKILLNTHNLLLQKIAANSGMISKQRILDSVNTLSDSRIRSWSTYISTKYYVISDSLENIDPDVEKHQYRALLNKAIIAASKDFGRESNHYFNTAWRYRFLDDDATALALFRKGFSFRNKFFSRTTIDYAKLLNRLGILYSNVDNSKAAIKQYNMALKILRAYPSAANEEKVNINKNLAIAYQNLDLHERAIFYYREAVHTMELMPKYDTSELVDRLFDEADLFAQLNYNDSAAILKSKAVLLLGLFKKGKYDAEYAIKIKSLALSYRYAGQYEKALPLLDQAAQLLRREQGELKIIYGSVLDNISYVYSLLGLYKQSLGFAIESHEIYVKELAPNDHLLANSFNNVGFAYERNDQYAKAVDSYLQSIKIEKRLRPKQKQDYSTTLHNLARCYDMMGKYNLSLPIHRECLAITQKIYTEMSAEYAVELGTFADIYHLQGQFKKELALLIHQVKIAKQVYGKNHDMYLKPLANLALSYFRLDSINLAMKLFTESNSGLIQHMQQSFSSLNENNQYTLLRQKDYQFEYLPSVIMQEKQGRVKDARVELYNEQLIKKGLILDNQKRTVEITSNSTDPQTQSLSQQWKTNRIEIGRQQLLPVKKRSLNLDSLIKVNDEFEQKLSLISAEFSRSFSYHSIDVTQIITALKSNQAAIEFIKYDLYGKNKWTDSTIYAALIISKEHPDPAFVPLFEEKQLQSLLFDGTGNLNNDSTVETLYDGNAGAGNFVSPLYNLIWKPLIPYLKQINTIYYSPAGLLNLISFQGISTGNNAYLIDSLILIQTYSTRAICEKNDTGFHATSAAVWGNISYGAYDSSAKSLKIEDESNNLPQLPGQRARFRDMKEWTPLEGTRQELDSITRIFTANNLKYKVDSGAAATESKFKLFDKKSPDIMHIATHGFFLPYEKMAKDKRDEPNFANQSNPMYRNGLIMAGANYASRGGEVSPGVEDGILTAYEIANLNLSSTRMIVLSACETGLGDVQSTEGVFGLQRAFKIAGIGNILVSLWSIADNETVELMTIFYRNLLSGSTPRQALRDAQLGMRKTHPASIWAAFALTN